MIAVENLCFTHLLSTEPGNTRIATAQVMHSAQYIVPPWNNKQLQNKTEPPSRLEPLLLQPEWL